MDIKLKSGNARLKRGQAHSEMFTKSSLACHDLALFLVYDDIVPSEQDVSPFSLLYNTKTESPGSPGLSVVLKRNLVFTKSSRQSHEIAAFILYDVIVAKLQHVSPISPSPFTTHTGRRPWHFVRAFCRLSPPATGPPLRGGLLISVFYPRSTKCLPKKRVKALGDKGCGNAEIWAGLPDVYQSHFFTSKAPIFFSFLLFLWFFSPMQGVWHKSKSGKSEKTSRSLGKTQRLSSK